MKKKWSILLTANLLSALVSPLMVHAVTPTTESEEILKNISQTSQTYASENIAQSDTIKQTLKNIQETYDTQKNTDDTSSTEDTTYTTSTTLSEESTQPAEKETTESDASNNNIQRVSAQSAIQSRAVRSVQTGTWGNVTWEFNTATGELVLTGTGTLGAWSTSPWNKGTVSGPSIKKITIQNNITAPSNSKNLFSSDSLQKTLANCTEISGIGKLNVSSVTNMEGMFANMEHIINLDLSNWNVSRVTDMRNMFENTAKDSSIKEKWLNISSFKITSSKPYDIDAMFLNSGFTKFTVGNTFDVRGETRGANFPIGTWYDEEGNKVGTNVGSNQSFLDYLASGNAGTYTKYKPDPVPEVLKWGEVPYTFDESTGKLTFTDGGTLGDYTVSPWNRTDGKAISASAVKKIEFTNSVKTPANSSYLFSDKNSNKLTQLTSLSGANKIDTTNATDMSYMFAGVSNLKTLDVSSFKTLNTTNMSHMFQGMISLGSLNVSSFETSKVKNMSYMFQGMTSITTLNVSNFNTTNVTLMNNMFAGMSNLTSIDVTKFNTSKVTNMSSMFANMKKISSLNLGNFDFKKVTNKGSMFLNDTLKEITLPSTFSDSANTTKLNDVPTDDTYNGNWVNINNKSKKLGQTKDFLTNEAGKAGTYVWGEKAEDVLKWGEVPYTFDESTGKLTFVDGGTLGDYTVSPWNRTDGKAISATAVKKIEFTKSVKTPANSSYLFSDKGSHKLTQLTSFTGLNNIDTNNATDMANMFYGQSSVTQLDLSHFITKNVVNMSNMFYGLSSLEILNVSSFDTSNVTDMTSMFEGLRALKELDISNFDTKKVTSMKQMFNNDSLITKLVIDNKKFDTSSVTDMFYMFNNMSSVTSLDVSEFNTEKVTTMQAMFRNNKAISSLNLASFNFSNVTTKTAMFENDILKQITLPTTFSDTSNNTKLNQVPKENGYNGQWQNSNGKLVGQTDKFLQNYNGITDAGTYEWGKYLTWGDVPYEFDETTGILTFIDGGTFASWQYSPWNRTDGKAIQSSDIKKIVLTKNVKTSANASYLFSDGSLTKTLTNTTQIEGLNKLDTSNAINMQGMFSKAGSLVSIDLSNFNTSNVTNMNSMFYKVTSVTQLDASTFDTKQVTDMTAMFEGSTSLKTLDLSNFDTVSVTKMRQMFNNLHNLATLSLDKTKFNTSNVNDMAYMFNANESLSEIDVTGFNTEKVENMYMMFGNMNKLTTLDLSSFNFSSVSNKNKMFSGDTLHKITLPNTFSDPNNTTKLNDVPTTDGYNGNWVNIDNKNVNLGQTSDFLKNTAGKAGTYIWGRQSALHLVKVPDLYDFGSNNAVKDITQIIKPTTSDIKNVEIRDDREQKGSWSLSVQASQLESDKLDNLGRARYQFDITSTTDANLPINGIDYVNKKVVLPTDNSSQILYSVTDDDQSPTSYNTWINDMKLIVPENTGKPNEQYRGTITWSLDLTPKD
ncbi:BspA family leucine-rich repeat surface protein [Vagococcus sp. JNUCC 83]